MTAMEGGDIKKCHENIISSYVLFLLHYDDIKILFDHFFSYNYIFHPQVIVYLRPSW